MLIELPSYPNQPAVNPDLEAHTSNFWPPKIIEVTNGVYVAVGYGLANSIMIEGNDGVTIVDTMMSYQTAKEVIAEFRKITDKPVRAIIYTHSHPDHIFGAGAFAEYADRSRGDDSDLQIYAHSTMLENYFHESGEMARLIILRGVVYNGTFLPKEGPDRMVNGGIGPFSEQGLLAFLPPTKVFDDRLDLNVAGVKMTLIYAPSETNDEIIIWLPEKEVLCAAEVIYKLWPNLYSIRGTTYRSVKTWIKSLQMMIDLNAKYLVPSHAIPISGYDAVKEILEVYHDGVKYVYDQTVRGINQFKTADELADEIDLPKSLNDHPWLQERYGERSWHVRGIYSGNVGWFQGDSAFLNPISKKEESMKIVELAGGSDMMIKRIREAISNGEYKWAAMLATYIINLEPGNIEAKLLKAHALRVLGQRAHSSGARNWYLSDALVLEGKIKLDPKKLLAHPEVLMTTPVSKLLENVPTRLNPRKADGINLVMGLEISDVNESYTFHIRNSVAVFTEGLKDNLDIKLIGDSNAIKMTIAGLKKIAQSVEDGDIELAKGDITNAQKFMSIFDYYVGIESSPS